MPPGSGRSPTILASRPHRLINRIVGLEYRQRMPKGVKVVQYFGLSFDGVGRDRS